MHILITSAASPLAQGLAAALKQEHQLRLTEQVQVEVEGEFVRCSLDHDFSTNLLVRGMDAILHVAEPLAEASEQEQIDTLTREIYNLLWAATAGGVRRVVYLSSLALMEGHDEAFIVTERWRPRLAADARPLAKYLGECVCREFAREHKLDIVVLRLGQVVKAEAVANEPFNPVWVAEQDVAQAVTQALALDLGRWSVFHIQADSPQARFPVTRAKKLLGYSPTVNFE
jgi:nucleoside-diphosphate-sugar epimerase